MFDAEEINKQCLLTSFVNVDNGLSFDSGQLFLYIFTFLGLCGSLVIILTSQKYIKTNSGFGYLILAMSTCDLLVSVTWLIANLVNDLTIYRHCVEDTDFLPIENYMIDNLFSINDAFLLASSFLGLAVAYIAIAVLYLNAITSNLKWKKLVAISFGVAFIYWILIVTVHTLKFVLKSCLEQFKLDYLPAIQDILISISAGLVVILSVILYFLTSKALQKVQYNSTTLMLNMIQAITISNIICWIPLAIYRSTLAAIFMSNYTESNLVYFLIFSSFTGTAPAKGIYHLLSLWISESFTRWKLNRNAKAVLDTIDWTMSKEKGLTTNMDDDTL
ncbi:hypothetical protein HDV01_000730 [Terramyces sp. JEL0728]|nr:hypothetical protein HDV01_000730 [Terramyces sp. JEL0728]